MAPFTSTALPPSETLARVLAFWFGAPGSDQEGEPRPEWFQSDPVFDEAIRERFADEMEAAAGGRLDSLMETPLGCVALCILLDQFPRNVWRDSPRAFACDQKARTVARHALDRGFDEHLKPVHRLFLYLPFEHSECLADQDLSVTLFESLGDPQWLDYARRHHTIIERFDRFPHRNALLGRPHTAAEEAFLRDHGRGF